MVLHRIAAAGMGFVAGTYAVFLAASLDGPPLFLALSAVGLAGALACAYGLATLPARTARIALAAGLLALLATRSHHFVTGLDEVGVDDIGGALSTTGLLVALIGAALWAALPSGADRARGIRVGFGITAAGYFATMLLVLSYDSLPTVLGMLLGTVGFSLAAPNVVVTDGEKDARKSEPGAVA